MTDAREGAGKTALVTGASSGIGAAFARVVARRGFDVVLTARRTDRLAALANELQQNCGIVARVIPADLASPSAPTELVDALKREGVAVDMLVNNAGYGIPAIYRDTSWEDQRDFLQVVVMTSCELTHRLLPAMTRRGFGRIVNVASVAGLVPGVRGNTLYGAAKSLLIGFSQSLHTEQQGTGVHATALCPGFTYTEFHDVTGSRSKLRRYPGWLWLDATRVAEAGYRAVMRNEVLCVPGWQYKAIVRLGRLLPLSVTHRIAANR